MFCTPNLRSGRPAVPVIFSSSPVSSRRVKNIFGIVGQQRRRGRARQIVASAFATIAANRDSTLFLLKSMNQTSVAQLLSLSAAAQRSLNAQSSLATATIVALNRTAVNQILAVSASSTSSIQAQSRATIESFDYLNETAWSQLLAFQPKFYSRFDAQLNQLNTTLQGRFFAPV